MFAPVFSTRPAAGSPVRALLALLAGLMLVLSPLAALGHHHDACPAAGDDEAGCDICLWQSHYAVELAVPTMAPPPAVASALPAPPSPRAPAILAAGADARAPPRLPA